MPIEVATPPRRVKWSEPDEWRRQGIRLEAEINDALDRARPLIGEVWQPTTTDDDLDRALEAAVGALLARMRSEHTNLRSASLVAACELAVELQRLRQQHQERRLSMRLQALSSIQDALMRPRAEASVSRLLEQATQEACKICGFDRTMLFRVDGAQLIAEATWFTDDPAWAQECHEVAVANPIQLDPQRLETEMLRRRQAALMVDPMDDPRAWKPIVCKVETEGYVAVPIMPGGQVIATLHADTHFSGRRVDSIDRDALAAFATGLGYAIERQVLVERLRAQRDHVRQLVQATEAAVADFCDADISLSGRERWGTTLAAALPAPAPSAAVRAALTRRELEVLGHMATGATNGAIARVLVISEATVKSHVEHILRKLRATNRAEAVSRFMRGQGQPAHQAAPLAERFGA